jgi:hypothetical protein
MVSFPTGAAVAMDRGELPGQGVAMDIRARSVAAFVLIAIAFAVLATPCWAQSTSLVTAKVTPMLGVFLGRDGSVGIGNTVDATVRRQRLGRTLLITVIPRI